MEYTKLEYIEGTGTQYIDLGFKLSSNHAVDLDLQLIKINANIFGSRYGAQNDAFTLFANGSSILTDMGGTRNSTAATTDRINVYLSSNKIKIGTFERGVSTYSFTTPGNGYIFNISYSRPQSYMASMKLYGCKIYLSGALIRDLIPCKYNNQIGLWDTINGSFLGNAGTGEFIAGPEQGEVTIKYTELKYIESTGTQYINTGINNINGVEIQFQYLAYKENASAFGARNGDASDSRFGLTLYDGYFHIMPPGQNVNGIITNKHIFKFGSNVNYQCYMDEELKINKIPTYKSSYNTYLFCECSGGRSSFYSNNLKIYYCKLYKDEVLVRDFIPCEYEGRVGLWDKVTNTFFANNGTGEFVAGPTIGPKTLKVKTVDKNNLYKKLEYIESTGTQYIDVGVKSNEVYGFEFKMLPISFNSNYSAFVGAKYDNYNVSFLTSLNSSFIRIRNIELTNLSLNSNSPTIWSYIGKEVKQVVNNNVTWSTIISAGTLGTTSDNINLFRCSAGNNTNKTTIRIYYYKLYDNNGNIVKDLIPVEKASDNTICLYDLVSNTFLENSGTGKFVAGPYSLIGKTVSKINGKYAKTINGVSIQCWKKKYE